MISKKLKNNKNYRFEYIFWEKRDFFNEKLKKALFLIKN